MGIQKTTKSVVLSPGENYSNWATTTYQRNLVQTFVDRGVSRGQRGGSPSVVNLSFLDRGDIETGLKYLICSRRTYNLRNVKII
jgi:hypothetical protein